MTEAQKPSNEIKIGFKSKPKEVISQCQKLIKDEKFKDLHLSAISTSIGDLVIAVEILKSMFPNLAQQNVFTTISPIPKEKSKKSDQKIQKLLPRLEIILSTNKKDEKKENTTHPATISEEERKILINTLEKKKKAFKKNKKYRRSFRNKRRWGYNGSNKRYAYSAKRTGYNWRKPSYNNKGRPYGKTPDRKKNNIRKLKEPRKNSGNKQVSTKN